MAGRTEDAVVVTGPEPVLVRRAAADALRRIASGQPGRAVVTIECSRKSDAGTTLAQEIAQAGAPSLFGDVPILHVADVECGDDAVQHVLKELIADPHGAPVVITHNGSAKGRGIVNAATKSPDATVVKITKPNEREIRQMARDEAKRSGGRMSDAAEQWLLEALGTQSLELVLAAVRQAVADSPTGAVDEAAVQVMIPQQAKVSSFRIVDHVWAGDLTEALRLLRGMEQRERGVGVSVVAAVAHGLRMMAVAGLRGARPPADMSVAPWQADRARDNVRRWGATGARIAGVAAQLPRWDADMKGGVDGGIALDDEQKMAMLETIIAGLAGPRARDEPRG